MRRAAVSDHVAQCLRARRCHGCDDSDIGFDVRSSPHRHVQGHASDDLANGTRQVPGPVKRRGRDDELVKTGMELSGETLG